MSLVDLRTRDHVTRVSVGDRLVYRLRSRGEKVAVAQDDAVVSVLQVSSSGLETLITSSKHTDYVRGLAWSGEECVWSVGWDKTVQTHSV